MGYPMEIYDLIIARLNDDSWMNDDRYIISLRRIENREIIQESLKNCRLASQSLSKAASPYLFHSASTDNLTNLLRLAESQYAPFVRRVYVGRHAGWTEDDYSTNVSNAIPDICVRNFRNVRHLTLNNPEGQTVQAPSDFRQSIMIATENTLREGLFPKLTDLDLSLSLANDFAELARTSFTGQSTDSRRPFAEMMSQLHSLDVEINDDSGRSGSPYFQDRISDEKLKFPNDRYAGEFFAFVKMARSIKKLYIHDKSSPSVLDMDLLGIENFTRLETLGLCRVKVSMDHIQHLIMQNSSRFRAIHLREVEVKRGEWHSLLRSFCSLSGLKYFTIGDCGYIPRHPNAPIGPPGWEDPGNIRTLDIQDLYALADLKRHVSNVKNIRNAPGLET